MTSENSEIQSYCGQCGGQRHHDSVKCFQKHWLDPDAEISGGNTWSTVRCKGCHNVTFVHEHWFSEDYVMTDEGPENVVHTTLYPPTSTRKMPEWGNDLELGLTFEDHWIIKLHSDIYAAIGLKAYGLAAMGARTIIESVITKKTGDEGKFDDKLKRQKEGKSISGSLSDRLYIAFDAGSAAAHRGHEPDEADINTLLNTTEELLELIYINPVRQARRDKDTVNLKTNTPPRKK